MSFKIIDRYILKLVLSYFSLAMAGSISLFVLVDIFSRYFKFVQADGSSDLVRLFSYYLFGLPELVAWITPFAFCLCIYFVLSRLEQNSQLVAIFSNGISSGRVLRVLLVLGLLLSLALFTIGEVIRPYAQEKKMSTVDPKYLEAGNLNSRSVSFRDRIDFSQTPLASHLGFSRSVDLIKIEDIDWLKKKSGAFHAILFDNNLKPRAKLYAKSMKWREDGEMILSKVEFFPYSNKFSWEDSPSGQEYFPQEGFRKKLNLKPFKVKTKVSLKSALLANNSIKSLNISELKYFLHNNRRLAEYTFRFIEPLYPFLMLMVSFPICLYFLLKSPWLSFFTCLLLNLMVFSLGNYFRGEISSGSLSPFTSVSFMGGTLVAFFVLTKKYTPS